MRQATALRVAQRPVACSSASSAGDQYQRWSSSVLRIGCAISMSARSRRLIRILRDPFGRGVMSQSR